MSFHTQLSTLAKNLKKVLVKKLVKTNKSKLFFREIAFLVVLNFFSSSKIDFWPYLNLQKMDFGQKLFRENDLLIS